MLIDWFTVCAQALNFLILVWLMQRFLYRPILRAIDARERRIALELEEANQKKSEAQKERELFLKKNEDFERQRADLMNQMNDEVESERFRLLDEVRQAADALHDKRMETMRSDARLLSQSIGRRAQQEVFAIARKTLSDLSTASLEERMVDVFVRHFRALNDADKEVLRSGFKDALGPVTVRSAFVLPAAQRTAIVGVLNELTAGEVPVCFEVSPDLVSGIDLTANGRKIAWNISDYLLLLEKGVGEVLEVNGKLENLSESSPEVDGSGTMNP